MNDLENNVSEHGADLEATVRENPTYAIVIAVGAGLALALLVRALQPRPVEHRAARLLEDLRERLNDLADPAYRRASGLARNSASHMRDGADQLSHLRLDRTFGRLTNNLRNLFC